MIFQQTFSIQNGEVVVDDNINIIPCSVSSLPDWNNYQPTVSEGDEKTRIQKRIDEYSQGLLNYD